ncbi:hypothetical protein M3689_07240 [Alkalihalophilus marmarensis]|uniref:Uncharacterized protein n=1 Tax=Alkalihalophilus marmarensis DSM 21297 TaxID=1188261 RepID=U6SPN1_9BACI|nr:hypothetical protein [Alkalihalophilus marmarensis]ERN52835.1 hypothetical protein A33I_14165 [Alkalihalophilus marmarensis DSM 21297]MCM3489088.1 hypothetical protein [Alkalihalophilus marmarensis]
MAKVLKGFIIAFLTAFFTKWLEDVFILSGLVLVVVNTYLISIVEWNILAGNYLLGMVLIILGFVLAKR